MLCGDMLSPADVSAQKGKIFSYNIIHKIVTGSYTSSVLSCVISCEVFLTLKKLAKALFHDVTRKQMLCN